MGGIEMGVRAEATPNPNAKKFTTDKLIFDGTNSISVMPGTVSEYDIMNDLMKLEGVDNVFGYQNFITVNKSFDAEWDDVTPLVREVFEKHGF
jgi:ASC-1-like (ASCH) protein